MTGLLLAIFALGLAALVLNAIAFARLTQIRLARLASGQNGEIDNIHRSYVLRAVVRGLCGVALIATALWPSEAHALVTLILAGSALVVISLADWWTARRAVALAEAREQRES